MRRSELLRKGRCEKKFDGLLVSHGARCACVVCCFVVGVFVVGFDHEGAQGEALDEVGIEPAVGDGFDLFERDGAAGEELGEDAETDADGAEGVGLEGVWDGRWRGSSQRRPWMPVRASDAMLGGGPGGVGMKVENDFAAAAGLLRLVGRGGEEHGVGQELEDVDDLLAAAGFVVDVFGEGFGVVEHVLEAGRVRRRLPAG